jgi:hypothetical protein
VSSLALFGRLWDAYGRGRLDDALELLDPACEVRLSPAGRIYRGHDGVRELLAERDRDYKSATLTYVDLVEVDARTLVAVGHLSAFDYRDALAVDAPVVWLAEFGQRHLVRVTGYSSRADALQAAEDRPGGADRQEHGA